MNEKSKNILSYILAILIVGSLIACFVIAPYKSLLGISWILLGTIGLVFIVFMVRIIKDILYMFFDSELVQNIYRDCITKQKHHKSNHKNYENLRSNQETPRNPKGKGDVKVMVCDNENEVYEVLEDMIDDRF